MTINYLEIILKFVEIAEPQLVEKMEGFAQKSEAEKLEFILNDKDLKVLLINFLKTAAIAQPKLQLVIAAIELIDIFIIPFVQKILATPENNG